MTRKDTILIAVVINAGLLAILFTTAVIYDTDESNEQVELASTVGDHKIVSKEPPAELIASTSPEDEVDNVLKYYSSSPQQPIVVQTQPEVYFPEPLQVANEVQTKEATSSSQEQFVEVKVKRGDVLEKIAKANKTTVGAIKRANQLQSERLSIGQLLKIPVKQSSSEQENVSTAEETKQETKKEPSAAEPVYYVIKSGDNPWKIAKQFGVKYDEILRLNNLDEEKARNLKIGDRVRVK